MRWGFIGQFKPPTRNLLEMHISIMGGRSLKILMMTWIPMAMMTMTWVVTGDDGDVDDVKAKSCKAHACLALPGRPLGKFLFQSKGFFLPAPPLRLAGYWVALQNRQQIMCPASISNPFINVEWDSSRLSPQKNSLLLFHSKGFLSIEQ